MAKIALIIAGVVFGLLLWGHLYYGHGHHALTVEEKREARTLGRIYGANPDSIADA
jgi:hypothetical protein